MRLIDSCITQLKAQGPSRTCNESKEEEEEGVYQRPGVCTRYTSMTTCPATFTFSDNLARRDLLLLSFITLKPRVE